MIDDLPALAALPSARLLTATDAMRLAFSRDRPGLFIARALHRQGKTGLLAPGLRAWSLTLAEVACARLPGGELMPDGDGVEFLPGVNDAGAAEHDRICPCGDFQSHANEPWMRNMRSTMYAVRDRDGVKLFELFDRAVYAPGALAVAGGGDVTSYITSLASSSCVAAAEAGLDRTRDALLHTLAYHAHSPRHWSVAGPVYRLASATLTTIDMGQEFAEPVIGPEITALGPLGAAGRLHALSVLGPAYAELLADDPAEQVDEIDFTLHPAGGTPDPDTGGREQAESADMAARFALAYRRALVTRNRDELSALVEEHGNVGIGLAVYSLASMLALRMRSLYG